MITIDNIDSYFQSFLGSSNYLKGHITSLSRYSIDYTKFNHSIGIHVRLGDFDENRRTDLEWYIFRINEINNLFNNNVNLFLFSDGSNAELTPLLSIKNVSRVYNVNPLIDILSLSECYFIIGSDSTFSGWGSFLGQVPMVVRNNHFGRCLVDESLFNIIESGEYLNDLTLKYLLKLPH
jgi:hypothetical protein